MKMDIIYFGFYNCALKSKKIYHQNNIRNLEDHIKNLRKHYDNGDTYFTNIKLLKYLFGKINE
jgi:hypothetical protein